MSIAVTLEELADVLAGYPWGYFVTVGADLRAHSLAVPTDFRDGVLHLNGGKSSCANAAARPEVTMVFPSPVAGRHSLILDGVARRSVDGVGPGPLTFVPSRAILHRAAAV